jgi:hypothetical protein
VLPVVRPSEGQLALGPEEEKGEEKELELC